MVAVIHWSERTTISPSGELFLTPYASAVAWKRAALKSGQHKYSSVKTERIERAIADDVACSQRHPTRTRRGSRHEAPAPITPEA